MTQPSSTILIPIFNDWESVASLLPSINQWLERSSIPADVLLVDDASTTKAPTNFPTANMGAITSIKVLRLRRNLGHQRAICVALSYIQSTKRSDRIVVMDGDGEDDPADVPRLIKKLEATPEIDIVFAERTKRSEGIIFTVSYHLYRLIHRTLVGHSVRVGNFSCLNLACAESLCVSSELWNHYAAAVIATRQRKSTIQTIRGRRIAGDSKMNFPALVMHGLSALSVFADRISTRILIFTAGSTIVSMIGIAVVLFMRFIIGAATPGWATTAAGTLLILITQLMTFALTFCFLVLSNRAIGGTIPLRDWKYFVADYPDS